MTIVVVSGGFDPLHVGHIRMIKAAREYGPVGVILNSDEWLMKKKGYIVSPWYDRFEVMNAIEGVTGVWSGGDEDGSVKSTLERIVADHPEGVLFCNGGDRGAGNVPEENIPGVKCIYGIGGTSKADSSSEMVKRDQPIVQRLWGHYIDHYRDEQQHVLKTLVVAPGQSTSLQRHFKRGEVWRCLSGEGYAVISEDTIFLKPGALTHVKMEEWHKITNTSKYVDLVISEYQYGECQEEDIERKGS